MRAEGIDQYPVSLVCETFGITRSAYYNRVKNPYTNKEQELITLSEKAKELFNENHKEYGRKRLKKALCENGYRVSEGKTRKLMQMSNLRPKKCRKYKATTNSKHSYSVAENLLKGNLEAERPNQKWCGDSTYIWTDEGWLYAAGIIDLCDKTCVGLTFSQRHTKELMIEALENAYKEYKPGKGLIFHSDRGVQYASNEYKKRLKEYGMLQSMSYTGNPYDNAAMESFWSTVKTGCIFGERFKTRKQAKRVIFEYVFGFYNTRRYHSSIGYEIPINYRKKQLEAA